MRIELRKSGGDTCPKCGAHELLYVPSLNQYLEADIREHFLRELPKRQVLRRRQCRAVIREMDRVIADLRAKTRHQVS